MLGLFAWRARWSCSWSGVLSEIRERWELSPSLQTRRSERGVSSLIWGCLEKDLLSPPSTSSHVLMLLCDASFPFRLTMRFIVPEFVHSEVANWTAKWKWHQLEGVHRKGNPNVETEGKSPKELHCKDAKTHQYLGEYKLNPTRLIGPWAVSAQAVGSQRSVCCTPGGLPGEQEFCSQLCRNEGPWIKSAQE